MWWYISEILKLGADVLVIPLTYIINFSISTGKFPSNWKFAKVVPLYKKGDKKSMKNYRPIALLSVAGMILERVVALQIDTFFENNKLAHWEKHAFCLVTPLTVHVVPIICGMWDTVE